MNIFETIGIVIVALYIIAIFINMLVLYIRLTTHYTGCKHTPTHPHTMCALWKRLSIGDWLLLPISILITAPFKTSELNSEYRAYQKRKKKGINRNP